MTEQQKHQAQALRKQGLSYRKIADGMRLSPNTVKSFYRRYDASRGLCKNCGAPLKQIPRRKPKIFCSDACRKIWWHEHRGEMNHRAHRRYTCAYCGGEFESYAHSKRRYCCHACYIRHRYGVP